MQVLPFESKDIEKLSELQPEGWDDIKLPFQYYLSHRGFCTPLKFVIDEIIAGTGTCVFHKDVAWLAHIIVHVDYRNRGLGKLITDTLVNRVKLHPYKTISLIATDLGEPVYRKVGFETDTEYLFYKNEDQKQHEGDSEFISRFEKKHLEDILELDKRVSGEDRSQRLLEFIDDSFVFRRNSKTEGYFFPSFGDGLIIASNATAGIELMKLRNKSKNMAVLPVDNKEALGFLEQNNFKHYRTAKRMTLGEKRKWLPQMLFNRVSGQIG